MAPGRCAPLQQILLIGPQLEVGAKTTNYSRRTADFCHYFHFAPPPLFVSLASSALRLLRCGRRRGRREGGLEPKDKGGPPPFPPTKVLSYFDASVASCDSLEPGGALRGSNTPP